MFLYASDFVAGLLFLWWLYLTPLSQHKKNFQRFWTLFLPASSLVAWFLLSSVLSHNPILGLYRTVKITEFLILFFIILTLPKKIFWQGVWAFVAGGVAQSIIGLAQFFFQHSLGLKWLGENILAPDIAGVAKLDAGQKIIRAYGTLPHPNVLGALLVCCILTLFWLLETPQKNLWARRALWAALAVMGLGLFVTFSRAALFTLAGVLVLWYLLGKQKPNTIGLMILLGAISAGSVFLFPYLQSRLTINTRAQEISFRVLYIQSALTAIKAHPVAGIGPGQFTQFQETRLKSANLPSYANQPVHNIYLLFASETGLVGMFLLYWFFYHLFYPLHRTLSLQKALPYLVIPLTIFILGLFDHFFITFQQGALLFWVALAFSMKFLPKTNNSPV